MIGGVIGDFISQQPGVQNSDDYDDDYHDYGKPSVADDYDYQDSRQPTVIGKLVIVSAKI